MQAGNNLIIFGKRFQERPIGAGWITICSSKVQSGALTTHVMVRCGQWRNRGHNSLDWALLFRTAILTELNGYFSVNHSLMRLKLLISLGWESPAIFVVEIERFDTILVY